MELDTQCRPDLISADAWLAPTAFVLGKVHIGSRSSVWFGTVIRGDIETIHIGDDTNIQDLCCLHADPGMPCSIGNRVTVGHGAIVHGATVQDDCLVGIRAVILNGAVIGAGSIVGAGALVAEGKMIPPRSLVVGTPARILREVTDEDFERIRRGTEHYVAASRQYAKVFDSANYSTNFRPGSDNNGMETNS
ncbi:MAG: gamma carbonic anhydrase family protein [Planctomycetales bacterium]|nr:gamma carbonic anhydrase family protein [Planctomycetales bacterium]